MSKTEFRRWRYLTAALLVAFGLLPIVSANAQDEGRVRADQLVKSVVLINTFACDEQPVPGQPINLPFEGQRCDAAGWKGSGSVIDAQGHILTNDHVIRPDRHGSGVDPNKLGWYLIYQTLDAKELPVALFYARAVAADENLDLAILEPAWGLDGQPLAPGSVDGSLPVLPLETEPDTVELEQPLRLLGYPREHPLVTVSTVNVVGFESDAKVGELGQTAWIRTDVASAGPGNSGGPAVNDAGQQVGVVSAGSRNDLDCQDFNGDGKVDVVSECVTPSGGSEYVRPIPEAYNLLLQAQQPAEPTPTPTTEAPPEPPDETPTATEEAPQPPDETPTATEAAPEPPTEPTEAPTVEPTPATEPTPTTEPTEPTAGTAIITGRLVSADTGDPIARGQIVILKPGISVKDWKRHEVGQEAILTFATSDARGYFQLRDPVERGVAYGISIIAKGYEELFKDNKVLATADDPAIVDMGTIAMPAQL